jgi:hypothetical protein
VIRANFATGTTRSYDLEQDSDRRAWEQDRRSEIRGATIVVRDRDERGPFDVMRITLPIPEGLRVTGWDAELIRDDAGRPVREVLKCYADKYVMILTVYLTATTAADLPTARVDWRRAGRLRLPRPD